MYKISVVTLSQFCDYSHVETRQPTRGRDYEIKRRIYL
nr:MAG TPA: hypothetical protein [Caudoviricetes sp.]